MGSKSYKYCIACMEVARGNGNAHWTIDDDGDDVGITQLRLGVDIFLADSC